MSKPARTTVVPLPHSEGAHLLFDEIVQAVWNLSRTEYQAKWENRLSLVRNEFLKMVDESHVARTDPMWWPTFRAWLYEQTADSGWTTPPIRTGGKLYEDEPEPNNPFEPE